MSSTVQDILTPQGAIARRLADRYEHRPQQLEMAAAVEQAFADGEHLLVEAGTGVGKSFAYLLPVIDHAVRTKKRVIISTHTISLQEQLIDKDIPLIQSVYPDEFTAVLVKGRSNYLCLRRLQQARSRQSFLFDTEKQIESLWMVEEWANRTTDGSLADLPTLPNNEVWDKVCAEHGNCLGKKCEFYDNCFWQSAKRRMTSGNILIVNHALFFADLALRMAGVNYLPKYEVVVLDEAHTLEDVAGEHFGLKMSEGGLRYELRMLYEPKRGRGLLNSYGACANDAIRDVVDLHDQVGQFFERCINWQQNFGRSNGRIYEPNWVENDISPKLRDLSKRLKAMLMKLQRDEDVSEITSHSNKVAAMAESLEAILTHSVPDAVYWVEVSSGTTRRVSLHAAPVNVADGLRKYLFDKVHSVVMTSATLCTGAAETPRGTGFQPVIPSSDLQIRQGAYLPHWTRNGAIYSVNFRLADSLPQETLSAWLTERSQIVAIAAEQKRPLTNDESAQLQALHSERVEKYLDASHGVCWLRDARVAQIVATALKHFDRSRYRLLTWCIMPNHVHAVLQPLGGFSLPDIIHSWKSFTANAANRLLKRSGEFWQPEYYDHLIRDENDLFGQIEYAWTNPYTVGLENWKWREKNENQIAAALSGKGEKRQNQNHGLEARATKEKAASADPRFAYIKSRLGCDDARTLQLGSPFDYSKQATLYIESNLPEPNDTARFLPVACEKILNYLRQTNGGAFVLFTSYKMLIEAANRLKPQLDALNLPSLVQGQEAPRRILLERFRSTDNAVLFGTASFWQGIDVQGEKLRNVIIVKLPFSVPDEPLIEARLEAIQRRGGNPFMEYSVPEAIIKLKQGFGRLIRSKTDTGIVVLLDSRVKTKRYGKMFLDALPGCRQVVIDRE